jgi:hypothetical protein
MHYLLI